MSLTLKIISPIDNRIYAERSNASDKQVSQTIFRALNIQSQWKQQSVTQRAALCEKAIAILVENKTTLAREITWQMGRPIRYAENEITGMQERALYMTEQAPTSLSPVMLPKKKGFTRYITHESLGVVLVIAPWNYPYLTAINSVIPALMAGNTVILKHASQTLLCAERLYEAFQQAGFPDGVFQYLHMTHEQTEKLIQSGNIAHTAFTGSVTAGKILEGYAVGTFTNTGLELGGKDPAYIRHDANINHAVKAVVDGAFFNSGQSCCSIERVYVHELLYDAFVTQAIQIINQFQLGAANNPDITLGPMVNTESATFVRKQIREAIEQGAIAHIDEDNFPMSKSGTPYLAPQLLTDVNHSMQIMTEESFGPVLGVQKVKNDEEAIALMNDSKFGLTAAVFTSDIKQGIAIGSQIETGTFFINRCDYLDPALAWTGVKHSGRGCTLSTLGYGVLTRPKSFHIKH